MTNKSLTLNGWKWNVESEEEERELLDAIIKVKSRFAVQSLWEQVKRDCTADLKRLLSKGNINPQ